MKAEHLRTFLHTYQVASIYKGVSQEPYLRNIVEVGRGSTLVCLRIRSQSANGVSESRHLSCLNSSQLAETAVKCIIVFPLLLTIKRRTTPHVHALCFAYSLKNVQQKRRSSRIKFVQAIQSHLFTKISTIQPCHQTSCSMSMPVSRVCSVPDIQLIVNYVYHIGSQGLANLSS